MNPQITAEIYSGLPAPLPEISAEELGSALRYHRRKARLTQSELAKLAGVGKTVVFDVEKGKPSVRLNTLLKILRAMNITVRFRSPLMEKYLLEQHAKR